VLRAIASLSKLHPRAAEVVRLRYIIGLDRKLAAGLLGITTRTARSDWRFAQAWWIGRDTSGGCVCIGDFNATGDVDIDDILFVISAWDSEGPIADLDNDGIVGVNDLLVVLDGWGSCD
jgi:hypothetical protein